MATSAWLCAEQVVRPTQRQL